MSRTVLSFTPEGLRQRLVEMEREIRDLKRIGSWQYDQEYEIAGGSFLTRNNAQLLVMTASSDSLASGGDYVTFTGLASQHGFADTSGAGDSWTHSTGGVYTLTYEHVWDSYTGGGTIALELDGVTTTANTIASGTTGSKGRGTISYVAAEGQVGKIKVTQSSGSAQTGSGTVWIALPDPTNATPTGSASVILLIDGVQVASASGDVGASFSTATMLLGVTADDPSAVSDYHYDEAAVTRLASNLIGNGGFESALAGSGVSTAVTTGNWRAYVQGSSTVARVASPVSAGSNSLRINVAGAADQGSFAFQDISALAPGETFDLTARVYPSGSGLQEVSLVFDWDRVAAAPHEAKILMTSSATSFSAFGLSGAGPALPASTWSEVTLRIGVTA